MTREELEKLLEIPQLTEETFGKLESLLKEKVSDEVTRSKVELQSEIEQLKETIKLMEHEREDLIAKADEYADLIREEMIVKGEEYAETVVAELTEKLESYSDYVVERFIEENKEVLIENRNTQKIQEALNVIRNTLSENLGLTVEPSEDVAELEKTLSETKDNYNKLSESYSQLKESLAKIERERVFDHATRDLADTQREKVQKLMEGMSISNKEYEKTLKLMVEEVVKIQTPDEPDADKETVLKEGTPTVKYDGSIVFPARQQVDFEEKMKRYLASLS